MTDSRHNPIADGDVLASLEYAGAFVRVSQIMPGVGCRLTFVDSGNELNGRSWPLTQAMMMTTQWAKLDTRERIGEATARLILAGVMN